jgi:hypothetical protein
MKMEGRTLHNHRYVNLKSEKKFWEDLIAYFPLMPLGPHRKTNPTAGGGFLGGPALNHTNRIMTGMSHARIGTKNDCAGEDQQQFTRPHKQTYKLTAR